MGVVALFLPLISFLLIATFGKQIGTRGACFLSTTNLFITFILSIIMLLDSYQYTYYYEFFVWLDSQILTLNWSFNFDQLAVIMFVVVTCVSSFVHLYSIEYMNGDPHQTRFMSYLSLFTFFMLFLVSSGNYLQLFLGWEGVGLASYLLINFWFTRLQANKSALKAVFVNRFGDFFLGMGIIIIFYLFKSLDFGVIFSLVHSYNNVCIDFMGFSINLLNLAALFLFLGAVGKSAQLGLHTWLPDAMEGPTPVSALIHAATMVTAGVFTLIRSSPILEYSSVLPVVAVVGSFTALFGASVAVFQNDLKKIIAYSTCSQLGYMVFACGLSQYSVAFFHLFNHAFFKALLFLSAGAVIHALSDEQDIRKMGGLVNVLPFSHAMFLIGSLALAGLPFISGFYSKDAILELAMSSSFTYGYFCYLMGVAAAFCTSFYSIRLLVLVFYVKPNGYKSSYEHAHEPNIFMTLPLAFLCLLSIFSGFIFKDLFIGFGTDYWSNTIFNLSLNTSVAESEFLPSYLKLIPLIFSISGMFMAALIYSKWFYNFFINNIFVSNFVYFLNKKWYFDTIYNKFVSNKFYEFSRLNMFKQLDRGFVETFGSYGFGKLSAILFSNTINNFQSGYLFNYVQLLVLGLLAYSSFIFFPDLTYYLEIGFIVLMFYVLTQKND
jgi:proton-translocating NADH-quinone oxidoreductase chain L